MGVRRARKRSSADGPTRSYRPRPRSCRSPARFKYKQQFGVIVICSGEREQERVYRRLLRQGHRCKVVVV